MLFPAAPAHGFLRLPVFFLCTLCNDEKAFPFIEVHCVPVFCVHLQRQNGVPLLGIIQQLFADASAAGFRFDKNSACNSCSRTISRCDSQYSGGIGMCVFVPAQPYLHDLHGIGLLQFLNHLFPLLCPSR